MNLWIILLTALLLPLPAQADIYKCRLANGKTEISNSPCSGGSSTITVRPDDTVSEENRQQAERDAERDAERMQTFVEKREAKDKAERERQADEHQWAVQQRIYESASMDECLRQLAQQYLDPKRRAELEVICRNKTAYEPTAVPYYYEYGGRRDHRPRVNPLHPETMPATRPGKASASPGRR